MIYTKLQKHQQDIVNFSIKHQYFGIFAGYGTGKTLCILKYIDIFKIPKVLVVATKTAINTTWVEEIHKHSNFIYVSLVGTKKEKLSRLYIGLNKINNLVYKQSSVLFLVNYDGIKNIYNELIQSNIDFIVVDESTKIKSPYTTRTKVLWSLSDNFSKKAILTGFPITENITELYSQIKFLTKDNPLGKNYYEFLNRYFVKHGYKHVPKRNSIKTKL